MFDIGFWELSLILVIALLVVGPEKLPKLASTAGRWAGQARRMVSNLQRELEREANQTTAGGKDAIAEAKSAMREIRDTVENTRNSIADIPKTAVDQVKPPQPKENDTRSDG